MKIAIVDDERGISIPLSRAIQSRGASADIYDSTEQLLFLTDNRESSMIFMAYEYDALITDYTLFPSPFHIVQDVHNYQKMANMPLMKAVFYSGGMPPRGFQLPENSLWLLKPSPLFHIVDILLENSAVEVGR